MKKRFVAILSTACLLSVTGCAGNQNDNATNTGMGNGQTQINRVSYNQDGQTNNNNRNLTVQSRAANNIERLNEVDQAQVIIRNNDAYVAVKLRNTNKNDNQNGNGGNINLTMTRTGNNDNENGSNRNAIGNNSVRNTGTTGNGTTLSGMTNENNNIGTKRAGLGKDMNNAGTEARRNNGTNLGNYVNETPTGNNPATARPGLGNNTNFTSNVGTDNRNNRAMNGNNYSKVSTTLEYKIADQVREADKNVHEVFVSVNSDFYNQMTNYTDYIENGQNRDGIYDQFTDTIRDFFDR